MHIYFGKQFEKQIYQNVSVFVEIYAVKNHQNLDHKVRFLSEGSIHFEMSFTSDNIAIKLHLNSVYYTIMQSLQTILLLHNSGSIVCGEDIS